MAKMKSVRDRRNAEVYDLQYSHNRSLDDDEINLPVHDQRPLSAVVSRTTLPTFTAFDYNPRKGKFTERKVQADADEVILNNAERHQGRLSFHAMTGRHQDSKHEKATGAAYPCPPMGSQFASKRKLKGGY